MIAYRRAAGFVEFKEFVCGPGQNISELIHRTIQDHFGCIFAASKSSLCIRHKVEIMKDYRGSASLGQAKGRMQSPGAGGTRYRSFFGGGGWFCFSQWPDLSSFAPGAC